MVIIRTVLLIVVDRCMCLHHLLHIPPPPYSSLSYPWGHRRGAHTLQQGYSGGTGLLILVLPLTSCVALQKSPPRAFSLGALLRSEHKAGTPSKLRQRRRGVGGRRGWVARVQIGFQSCQDRAVRENGEEPPCSDSVSPPPASSPDPPLATATMQATGKRLLQPGAASSLPEPEAAAELRLIVSSVSLSFCLYGRQQQGPWEPTLCCEGASTPWIRPLGLW